MRIVFIGCVEFSRHCLKEVLKNNGDVVGVVTRHDDGLNSDYADLSVLTADAGLPIHYSDDVNDKVTLARIKELSPDIIFCFGWSQLIKQELLSLPTMGVLGAHPSLLPNNRGRHPIIWALVLGLKETGLTFFFMNKLADAGPILAQKEIAIHDDDTARSLYDKIESVASMLIKDFMPRLLGNNYELLEQDVDQENYWRKRTHKDGMIDWRMSATAISRLVRALTRPYPGAEFLYKENAVKVWSAIVVEVGCNTNIEPGKVIEVCQGVPIIKCQEGALKLLECEPDIMLNVGEYLYNEFT